MVHLRFGSVLGLDPFCEFDSILRWSLFWLKSTLSFGPKLSDRFVFGSILSFFRCYLRSILGLNQFLIIGRVRFGPFI